jgi:AraC-like DNA-binding protein
MGSLWELAPDTPGARSHHWEESFAAAAAAALFGGQGEVEAEDLRRVIVRHVRATLQDRNLSVRAVAARFGISPRTLHELFAEGEESFGRMVRRARLRRCAELLADPGCTCPVAEVGAQFGFADAASFGRAFRREFGTTPGEVRRSRSLPADGGPGDPPASVQFVRRG